MKNTLIELLTRILNTYILYMRIKIKAPFWACIRGGSEHLYKKNTWQVLVLWFTLIN